MADLLSALYDFRAQLLLWTAGYIFLYALASNLIYRARQNPQTRLGRIFQTLELGPGRRTLFPILEFGFYVGIPYLALLLGITNSRLMGLLPQDWIEGMGMAMVLGTGAFLLLLLVWLAYLRSLKPEDGQAILATQPYDLLGTLLNVIQLQAHWAFLRSAPLLIFGDYNGVFVGWGLVLLEGWTNPFVRHGLFKEGQEQNLHIASMALVSAVAFYYTQNLWLTSAMHLALELGLWKSLRRLLPPMTERLLPQTPP